MRQNPKANLAGRYDICVIGGGIQGAGVARDAAMRGLSVVLLEAADWGGATSSNSSKLIHGGLRYLERLEFRLVYESLHERAVLMRIAPHLVKPLPFIIPFYKGGRRAGWLYRLGLTLYDLLAGRQPLPRHQKLSRDEITGLFPFLRRDDLLGGVRYYDCQMQDARLVLENVLDAQQHGADCRNYTPVTGIERLPQGDYRVRTQHGDELTARQIVNAAGPWIDAMLETTLRRGSRLVSHAKGVHLLLQPPHAHAQTSLPSPTGEENGALLLETAAEERIFFLLPWNSLWLVGTTDTPYHGDLRRIPVEPDDIDYLLHNLGRYCNPDVLTHTKLITTYAGIRPLAYVEGRSTRDISRDYEIRQEPPGFFSLIGGKYTVYRRIAEQLLDDMGIAGRACRTHLQALPGADAAADWRTAQRQLTEQLIAGGIGAASAKYLSGWYGKRCLQLLPLIQAQPRLSQPLLAGGPWIEAEVIFAVAQEQCRNLRDFCMRRTQIFYSVDQGRACLDRLLDLMGEALQWDEAQRVTQRLDYINALRPIQPAARQAV